MVVVLDEVIELGLLLQEVLSRWLGRFLLQGQVHALMPTILLRLTGLDAFEGDAEA